MLAYLGVRQEFLPNISKGLMQIILSNICVFVNIKSPIAMTP